MESSRNREVVSFCPPGSTCLSSQKRKEQSKSGEREMSILRWAGFQCCPAAGRKKALNQLFFQLEENLGPVIKATRFGPMLPPNEPKKHLAV